MIQRLFQIALLVREYDEALRFYVDALGFTVLEDSDRGGGKRWVRVAPPRVDDLRGDYVELQRRGVRFIESPREELYGSVAVLLDLYGNKIDLIQPGGRPP